MLPLYFITLFSLTFIPSSFPETRATPCSSVKQFLATTRTWNNAKKVVAGRSVVQRDSNTTPVVAHAVSQYFRHSEYGPRLRSANSTSTEPSPSVREKRKERATLVNHRETLLAPGNAIHVSRLSRGWLAAFHRVSRLATHVPFSKPGNGQRRLRSGTRRNETGRSKE